MGIVRGVNVGGGFNMVDFISDPGSFELSEIVDAMSTLVANTEAMGICAASEDIMDAIVLDAAAMADIAGAVIASDKMVLSLVAMDIIVLSTIAMDAMASDAIGLAAMASSQIAIDAINTSNLATGKYLAGASALDPTLYADMTEIATTDATMDLIVASSPGMDVAVTLGIALAEICKVAYASTVVFTANQLRLDTILVTLEAGVGTVFTKFDEFYQAFNTELEEYFHTVENNIIVPYSSGDQWPEGGLTGNKLRNWFDGVTTNLIHTKLIDIDSTYILPPLASFRGIGIQSTGNAGIDVNVDAFRYVPI